jgi:hypothetical protein
MISTLNQLTCHGFNNTSTISVVSSYRITRLSSWLCPPTRTCPPQLRTRHPRPAHQSAHTPTNPHTPQCSRGSSSYRLTNYLQTEKRYLSPYKPVFFGQHDLDDQVVQFYSSFFHAWATKWCGSCMKKAKVKLANYIVKIV